MHRGHLLAALAVVAGVVLVLGLRRWERPAAVPARTHFTCDSCTPPPTSARRPSDPAPRIPDGSGRPGVLLFYAPGSPECLAALDSLNSLSPKLQHRVAIFRVDANRHRQEAIRWRVRIVPTWIILSGGGKETKRHEGAASGTEVLKWLRSADVSPGR